MTTLARSKKLYRSFREREPTRVKRVSLPIPRSLTVLGYLSAVEYDTTHGKGAGASRRYRHVFAAGSRPLFATDGKRLYALRGRFRVTARGIVDLNAQGREIE